MYIYICIFMCLFLSLSLSLFLSMYVYIGVVRKSKSNVVFQQNKSACGRLFSRKQLLGLPIHMKMTLLLMNIGNWTILVSNRALYKA